MQDEQLESFLREFEPRRPRALPSVRRMWPRRLAAAAVVVVVLGGSLWLGRKHAALRGVHAVTKTDEQAQVRTQMNLLPLTRMALEDPARLDRALSAASREMLPDLHGSESTLGVLAKE